MAKSWKQLSIFAWC